MSARGTRERGTRGRGRGIESARAGSLASSHMPNIEARDAPASLVTESGSYDRAAGDDTFSQAMICILEKVIGTSIAVMGRGSISKRLRSNRAKIFRGVSSVAPNVVEYWLEAMERIMDDLDCTSEQKLKGTVSLLRDEAYQWWLTVREGTQAERLTWDFFKSIFQGKYVGASYMDARRKEFLSLTQGNKTIAEYEAEFLRLSCYARGIVATEYEHYRERDFAALVEKEKIVEDVKRSKRQNCEKDRGRFRRDSELSSSSSRPKKKARFYRPVRAGVTVARLQPCVDCGRHHLVRGGQQPMRGHGQVRGENGVGRGHGTYGRGVCNIEVRQPVLVYATHHREDGDASDVITVKVEKLFRDVPLEVQGVLFLADLIELLFGEFDLILGMDWLVKHHASLDCAAKHMVLKTTEDEEVVVIGERRDFLSNVISALKAEKLVRKGCEAFLAYVGVFDSEGPSIGDIRTVKDFSDVFPNELPRLPPSREVEFGIELLPGTALVSIAPYRMAPKELVELKAQI
ncbi:uncharacterized protein LOC105781522 [Gossypium raimondii]|uniref:uncharacterized protein LOC105781522 n=1 Tax=Gossypium raimondii TaxID=29730 RepID=UPI00063A9C98|nr:uncharacterized protein LOC105781522 [Gossypium raimondii]